MTITDGYLTRDEAIRYVGQAQTRDNGDDLDDAITTASRAIDAYCQRQFFQQTAQARVFEAEEMYELDFGAFNDLVSLTTLKVDRDGDGSYEETISSTNYTLCPANAAIFDQPHTEIELLNGTHFPLFAASGRENLVQITGTWGWPSVPPEVKQACRIIVAELMKLGDAPLGVAGIDATSMGVYRVGSNMPAPARRLLAPFRHAEAFGIG